MHRHSKNFKRLLKHQTGARIIGVLIIVVVAGIGIYLFNASHAATPTASLEAEAGTLSNGATAIADTTASGGQYVQFGSPTSQTWDCTVTSTAAGAGCPLAWPTQYTDPVNLTGGNDASWGYPYTGTDVYALGQDVWSPEPGQTQTIKTSATNAGDWQVTANVITHADGSVTTYPNSGTYSYGGVLDDYTSLTSTNTVSMPSPASVPNTIAHAMQDDWLSQPGDSNWDYEIMIQYDHVNDPYPCFTDVPYSSTNGWGWNTVATDVVFNGQPWFLCDGQDARTTDDCPSGGCGALIWEPGTDPAHAVSESSVTLDLKQMFQWLETHTTPANDGPSTPVHYMRPGSSLFAISSGFEVVTTGGVNETFSMSNFSVHATGAPAM